MTLVDNDNDEPKLSFVSIADDNVSILINGESKWVAQLPISISKKNAVDRKRIIENAILDACNNFGIDYVSEQNVAMIAKEIVDQLYERARVTKNYVPPPAHEIIANKYGNDYFEYLIDCNKREVKGEDALVRHINYTFLSAYCHDPGNLGIISPTSTGKTFPVKTAAQYTPGGKEVRIIGSMSPKVLIREHGVLVDKDKKPIVKELRKLKNAIAEAKKSKSKNSAKAIEEYQDELAALLEGSAYLLDLSNTTLIFTEPPHPETWNLLKPILSHDYYEMEHPFVEKIASGGLEVKHVVTRGWPAFIFCSAKDESKWDMWPEIESRFSIESPNMVQAKFQAGNKLIAQRKGLPRILKQQLIISDTEKALAQKCFLYLKHQIQQACATTDSPVWIPYGEILSNFLPSERGQDNRAANRLFTMINIITLSKAHLRQKLLIGDEELVISTLQDLREALHIMQNMTGLPPHKLRFYDRYILPLYQSRGEALETREICDFYNVSNPKSKAPMNSNNLLKNYLNELVNHGYLEQEKDGSTKALRYKFIPLLVNDDEEPEAEKQEQQLRPSTSSTFGRVYHYLQFSKILLPENHEGIPEYWLNQGILQLSNCTPTQAPLKILDPKGNDISIDEFTTAYETQDGLKFRDFFKVPRSVYRSKSADFTTSEHDKQGQNEKNTTNDSRDDKKRYTEPKVYQVDDMIEKALRYGTQGNDKGYFTKDDFAFVAMMRPNENWTEDEIEQTLQQLLREGKIVDLEPGKYSPTSGEGNQND